MRPFREHKLHFGFLIISFIMVVIGLYAYQILDRQKQQGEWVAHTHEVLGWLANLSLHLSDAETGQHGYLLTGQAMYLQPYSLALQQIDGDMARFQQLTRDNPRQQSQMPLLRGHIAATLSDLKQTIALRNSLKPTEALKVVFFERGRREMKVIRQQIEQMQAEELRLLNLRFTRWQAAVARTRWILLSGGALLYVLFWALYAVMQKETRYRTRLFALERQAAQDQRTEAERLAKVVATLRDVVCARQDLQAIMQTIVERTQEITHADGGVVEMLEGDEMVYRAVSGTATPHLGLRLKAATSLSGRCVREKVLLKCDDAETDDRVDKAGCRKVGVSSMLVVPLFSSGQLIGVLKVMSSRKAAFTEQHIATLELMAGVLSTALSDAEAMEALRISNERLDEAQQVAHVGSWEFNVATQKITWSKELFRLFGMDPEQGEPDYETAVKLYAPDDAARLDACFQRALNESTGYEIDLQQGLVPKGGTPRWYHAIGKPVFDAQGKVIHMVGTLSDITESKRHAKEMQAVNEWLVDANAELEAQKAKLSITNDRLRINEEALQEAHSRLEARVQERTEALQKSEALYRATFAQAAMGMAHVSLDGRWLQVNDKLCKLVGYSREELLALRFQDITHPDDLYSDVPYVARVIAGEIAPFSLEKRYLHKDGATVWINLTVALMRDEDEIPQYFISIIEDISERKKAQEALQDSETRYRFLADVMPQIMWTSRPDGNLNFYNQRWFDYTGLTLEETQDWGWQPVLHPDDLQNCIARWTRAYTTGEPYEVEYRFKRATDGVYRWHLGRALPLRNETGEIIQWVGTCTDIEEFKQAHDHLEQSVQQRTEQLVKQQEELRASESELRNLAQELARSNTDLEQFAYVASHDLQEPLRMIGSYLELLHSEYSERLDDEARKYIVYAVDGAVRMKALINDLLAFSRLGTQANPMQAVAAEALLREVLGDLHLRIVETNAVLTCGLLPTVFADASQLRLVFQNLIGNALKFQGAQTPHIHVAAEQREGSWQFAVRDNGIGMQAKHLERIFVIFQRLHNKSKYAGTGIGLATCKRIVERHGGRIWVESEPGQGSTFFFTLPASPLLPSDDLETQEVRETFFGIEEPVKDAAISEGYKWNEAMLKNTL